MKAAMANAIIVFYVGFAIVFALLILGLPCDFFASVLHKAVQ